MCGYDFCLWMCSLFVVVSRWWWVVGCGGFAISDSGCCRLIGFGLDLVFVALLFELLCLVYVLRWLVVFVVYYRLMVA